MIYAATDSNGSHLVDTLVASALMGADELYTRAQAAAYLGIGLRQLGRYQDSGRLRYLKNDSGYIRFTRKQLDDFRARRNHFVPVQLAG